MTHEDIVRMGISAQTLKDNAAFIQAVEEVQGELIDIFLSSMPSARDEREKAYDQYRCLLSLIGTINQKIATYEELRAAEEYKETIDD